MYAQFVIGDRHNNEQRCDASSNSALAGKDRFLCSLQQPVTIFTFLKYFLQVSCLRDNNTWYHIPTGGATMPSKRRSGREAVVGKKLWVSYRLQSLTAERFIIITNKILQGEHFLVKLPKISDTP